VKYLSHNASFHSKEKIASSNPRFKHLDIYVDKCKATPKEVLL